MKLGVFSDPILYAQDGEVTADRAYLRFVLGLAERVDELVLFGRIHPKEQEKPYHVAPSPRVRIVGLPYYSSISDVRGVLDAWRRSADTFAAELNSLDAVWLFAPNPLSFQFARSARRRGVPVALAIRQDFPEYIAHRYPRRPDAHLAAHALEHAFRRLARSCPTVVVGDDLERTYAHARALLSISVSQISSSDIVDVEEARARPWQGTRRLLSVGRLEREKNPLLLPEVLALLIAEDGDWELEIVGEGDGRAAVADRARQLGVSDAVHFTGYVPAGDRLWERYRASHAFLHVSLTEGVPSVIFEAQAAGTPVVASDVGGVGAVIRHERTGLLIRPNDARAAAEAIVRLARNAELRRIVVAESLAEVTSRTSDVELDRVATFFRDSLTPMGRPTTTLVKP